MSRRFRDPLTKDLFDWQPPQVAVGYGPEVMGRGRLDNRIARSISQALRDAKDDGKSRAQVARSMSEYLGRSISEAMLNKWSSEGSEDHRIPLDAFIGLVHATEVRALLGLVPGEFGLTVVEDEYAELITDQLLDDHLKEMEALKLARAARRKARR
ncbi:MAG: hypothetical protein DI498_10835 [Paracoccus denitrificans]|nr:MAG: hypothetical protein DI498_10835 [Paracoccus denitrificans]PZO83638.1 MAG: hypothetical protein DI633_10835 [Paracoccus denitrificans]